MLIANCPHCSDPIRIPGAADASSRVRCPWCEETYLLADVFEHLPPLVEVLEGPGSHAEIIASDAEDEYQLAGAAAPDFNFKESEGTGSSSPAPLAKVEGRSVSSARRPAKNGPNPVWGALKVVVGGVFGILAGFFVLMWWKNNDYIHIVPYLPSAAYFAVPEDLWTDGMRTAAGKNEDEKAEEQEAPGFEAVQPNAETLRVNKEEQPAEPAGNGQVKTAVDGGMLSLADAFNEAKSRGDTPPPKLGESDFVPPPKDHVVVKPSPQVDVKIAAELAKVTAEIGPIGAELPAKAEPAPLKPRQPNVSLDPAGK